MIASPLRGMERRRHARIALMTAAILMIAIPAGAQTTGPALPAGAQTTGPTLPDREQTPGVADPDATVNDHGRRDICNTTTGNIRAHLQPEAKKEAFRRYEVAGNCSDYCAGPQGCEIDHLISLELGGSNDVNNLWPQKYDNTKFNAHVKDALESRLNRLVCTGSLTLIEAQRAIATDWIGAFTKFVSADPSTVSSNGVARCH